MPTWLKILLAVALLVVLLVVGVVAAGVFWWSRNKDALITRAKEVVAEGKDFGAHSNNQGCIDESIVRYKKERGFATAISTSMFMRTCLDASKSTPGFCDDVPKETEFIKSGKWRAEQCRNYDLAGDRYCQNLFQPVQQYCAQESSR
ncbi:MAG TPA: hypothetical protein VJT71_18630 [Pyrinomonadaceae bacterium]|nr:hypothetical protein [Pyrinomonadaceae bacterium]